jgi:hypothetical protein
MIMLVYIDLCPDSSVQRKSSFTRKIFEALNVNGHYPVFPFHPFVLHNLELITRCDAILSFWNADDQTKFRYPRNLPIYHWPIIPPPCETEQQFPEQTREFMDVLMRMYHLHIQKMADYGSASVLGTGEIGVMTYIWGKVTRLMNLFGYKLMVHKSEFTAPREPKNESIDDSLIDLANYAVIAQVLRKGVWGK